ncbi:MAG: alpha/beta fold hydrolase [Bacteroidetes bacterium]|nr:alpha/beta fold hydrolase [Bacteroidota bacterium]
MYRIPRFLFCLLLLAMPVLSYALQPVKEYGSIPDAMHVPYENNTIITADGLHLKSWTILPHNKPDNRTTLVLAYADAGNMSWWLQRGIAFAQNGYTVVLFDYRGFGESDNFPINPKMLYYNEFAKDLSAAVQFAKKKYKGNKTGILCYSMGTVIATLAAADARPDFIIGEGYVTDPIAIVNRDTVHKKISLPPDAAQYHTKLERLNVKMLIFSGSTDAVTTDEKVQELKKKKPGIKVINFKGGHMQGFDALSRERTGSEYIKAVNEFLKGG